MGSNTRNESRNMEVKGEKSPFFYCKIKIFYDKLINRKEGENICIKEKIN